MDKPPFMHRPNMRSRRSLQETTAPSMRSVRRQDRHSIGGTGATSAFNSLHVSLLEHLQVQFIKAIVPSNKLSRPRYVMKVTNVALNRSWEMVRPFKEFWEMKEDLLRALDHGHLCKSNCPWIYMFVSHHFPRRHFFRGRQASVISVRLAELEAFINQLLKAMKEDRSLDCTISADALPKILYGFLYEGMVFDRSDFANTVLESRVSIGGITDDLNRSSLCPEDECTICHRPLKPSDNSLRISRTSDPTSSSSDDSNDAESGEKLATQHHHHHVSLTTLECGHRFHDECILEKLNLSLQCPQCATEKAEK